MLKALGLSEKSGSIWMTASIFGLMYSAPVIVEEIKAGNLGQAERERLHLSVGINHSIFEDPVLFLSFGPRPLLLPVLGCRHQCPLRSERISPDGPGTPDNG